MPSESGQVSRGRWPPRSPASADRFWAVTTRSSAGRRRRSRWPHGHQGADDPSILGCPGSAGVNRGAVRGGRVRAGGRAQCGQRATAGGRPAGSPAARRGANAGSAALHRRRRPGTPAGRRLPGRHRAGQLVDDLARLRRRQPRHRRGGRAVPQHQPSRIRGRRDITALFDGCHLVEPAWCTWKTGDPTTPSGSHRLARAAWHANLDPADPLRQPHARLGTWPTARTSPGPTSTCRGGPGTARWPAWAAAADQFHQDFIARCYGRRPAAPAVGRVME